MDLNHLHLHVADLEKTQHFYERYFGFAARARHGDILFLRNEAGFDLAVEQGTPGTMPPWFHFGFRLQNEDLVRQLHARMQEDSLPELEEEVADYGSRVTFGVPDPDGYGVEVYTYRDQG